jgi:hypothetical protein
MGETLLLQSSFKINQFWVENWNFDREYAKITVLPTKSAWNNVTLSFAFQRSIFIKLIYFSNPLWSEKKSKKKLLLSVSI